MSAWVFKRERDKKKKKPNLHQRMVRNKHMGNQFMVCKNRVAIKYGLKNYINVLGLSALYIIISVEFLS